MKEEKRINDALAVLQYLDENIDDDMGRFTVLMTALSMFFITLDPKWDALLDGLEKALKRIVKARREDLRKAQEKTSD
jgi:hypothetical protein